MTSGLSEVRAVTFDVGGTLIEPWPSVGHVYARVASKFGIAGADPEALDHGFARAWKARREFDYSRSAWRVLVERTFSEVSAESPGDACFDAIYDYFACAEAWRTFADTTRALAALRARGLKVGLISNWDERLRPLLGDLGLTAHFDAITISCEVGSTKPGREIFCHCADQLGLEPDFILHIGDSLAEDVAGAKAAGLRALLLDRRAGDVALHTVPNLDAAVELLSASGDSGPAD